MPSGVSEATSSLAHSVELPLEFDARVYRDQYSDLRQLDLEQLHLHYERFGEAEGRRGHRIANREGFVGLIPSSADVLEIGPFHRPLLRGSGVRYFDIGDRAMLQRRARKQKLCADGVPEIDFVSPAADLSVVRADFDVVLSSHVIEHQPDLVEHLQQVERLLRAGGSYFALVPDKAYCFDHFNPESSLGDVIEAHRERRRRHGLRSLIGYYALTTHNDCVRHWCGDHGSIDEKMARCVPGAIAKFEEPDAGYLDVHAWYFRPRSFRMLMNALTALALTHLRLVRLYPTQRFSNEFWAVLQKLET